MTDEDKTKQQLIDQLTKIRQRVAELEQSGAQRDAAITALRESEERLRAVGDYLTDWEYWINPAGEFVYVSPSCEWITGYGPDEFRNNPRLLETVVHPEDRELVARHLREMLEMRAAAYLEFRIKTRTGEECWIQHLCQPLYNAEGRHLGQRASNRDVTERVRTEKVLRESSQLLQRIYDTIPEAIIVMDPDLKVSSCNQSVQRILGYAPGELIGLPYGILVAEDQFADAEQNVWQAELFEKGYLEREEFLLRKKEGELFPASFSLALLRDEEGGSAGLVGTIRDMTDLKQTEATLERRTRQQEQLLETARHLTGSLNLREVLSRIASGAREILEAYGCAIYLLEQDGQTLTPVVAIEPPYEAEVMSTPLNVENSFTGQAVRARQSLLFNDAAANAFGHQIPGTPVEEDERVIVAPFIVDGKVLGAMCLNRFGTPYSKEHLAVAETFAAYAATVLRNAQTYDTLQREVEERKRAEAALRIERDRAQGYLDIAGVMMLALNTQGEVALINRRGRVILEYEEEELLGRDWFDTCLPVQFRDDARSAFEKLVTGENDAVQYYAGPVLTKSGEERMIAWHNTVLKGEAGKIVGTLSSGEDITERVRAEHEITERRVYLERILASAPDAIVTLDPEHRVVEWNPGAERLFGYLPEEAMGKNLDDLITGPDVLTEANSFTNRALRGEDVGPLETVRYRKDGTPVDVILAGSPILVGGELIGLVAVYTDISARARAEEEIQRRNREMTLLNRVVMAATSTLDVEFVLDVTCQELAQTFGLPQAAAALLNAERTEANVVAEYLAAGRPSGLGNTIPVEGNPVMVQLLEHQTPLAVTDAQTDQRLAPVRELLRERGTVSQLLVPIVLARGRVAGLIELDAIERREFSEEEIALARNVAAAAGQALEMARLYQAVRRQAERLGETVAQRTIELQEALEQAKSADRVKSEFVSNVSHELRTPLANLKLYLSLLTRGLPEKRETYLYTLHREADRLQDLIEGLLDLSRLDLGKTEAILQPTDLNLLVSTLVTDRSAMVSDRGLSLDVETLEELPQAMADPKLSEQVLTNLLTNAINYTPAGGTIILRTSIAAAEGRNWVTVSVTDNGPGISRQEQLRLFERFYRGQAGRASNAPGTGLGLAICQEIMELHGGRISVESQLGQGSTFTIWFSIAE